MPRVTQSEVRSMSGLDVSQSAAVEAAIPVASTLVDEQLASKGLTESTMKSVELLLSCHFALLSAEDGPKSSVRIGEASERYHDIYGPGFKATRFGQQAMVLDTSGTLSALSAKAEKTSRHAQFRVVDPIHTPVGDPTEDDV